MAGIGVQDHRNHCSGSRNPRSRSRNRCSRWIGISVQDGPEYALGHEPLLRSSVPALTRGRLSWVSQKYVRGETIAAANARLVAHHTTLPLTAQWGEGDVASADGLRFVVPVRTINAGPNPRYFGTGRGVTYLNFTSDQFIGFSGLLIPGTLRDSIYILEGLLQNETSLRPVQIMTDTASYSDLVFGRQIILRLSGRLRFKTSYTRLRPPI